MSEDIADQRRWRCGGRTGVELLAPRRPARIPAAILAAILLGSALPGHAAAGGGWNLAISGNTVAAQFISELTRPDVEIALTNRTGVEFLGPNVAVLLNLLGLKGTYSQELTWTTGSGPVVGCPVRGVTVDCGVSGGRGHALIPGGIRAIVLARSQPGATNLTIAPGSVGLEWDMATTAVGIVLTALAGNNPVTANSDMVVQLVIELLPEAVGAANALARHDGPAAVHEFSALLERAKAIIGDHLADWIVATGIQLALDAAGALPIELTIQAAKALPLFISLAAAIATGARSGVTVSYGSGSQGGPNPGSASIAYTADFSGWTGSPDWQPLSGMLVNNGGSSGWTTAPYQPPGSDYSVEAEIQIVRVMQAGSIVGRASEGLVVRGMPAGGYYMAGYCTSALVISPCADAPPVFGIFDASGSPLGSSPAAPADNGWHTYRVDARSDVITLSIDGSVVATAMDNRALSGTQVGLIASGIQVNVRSFKVLSP